MNTNGDGSGKKLLFIGGAVLLGIAVVNNAYEAGLRAGLIGSGRADQIGEIDGWGFFPFPPFPVLLLGFGLFFLYRRGVIGGRNGRGGSNGHGPAGHGQGQVQGQGRDFGRGFGPGGGSERGFGGQPPQFVMEWHRRLHEAERAQPQPQPQPQPAAQAPVNGGQAAAPPYRPASPAPPAPMPAPGAGAPQGGGQPTEL